MEIPPEDRSDPEFSTTSWQRLSPRRKSIWYAVTGGLLLVVAVVCYFLLASVAEQKEKEAVGVGSGYGMMSIFLICPCLLGISLLIAGIASISRKPGTPPNA